MYLIGVSASVECIRARYRVMIVTWKWFWDSVNCQKNSLISRCKYYEELLSTWTFLLYFRYLCCAESEELYDPDDILSISRFCYSFHVTRDFLPEIVRKHIGSFRTESHLKVNRENNHTIKNTNIVERTNNSTSNNVITVNVGNPPDIKLANFFIK